jgi:DNA-3-methyladenine glycosylase I
MATPDKSFRGPDGRERCWWCAGDESFGPYHDEEWGFPVDEDRRLFEKICLEGFQAGLSWRTILNKRENFRKGFANFEIAKVAKFGPKQVEKLLGDAGIVRHLGKIESTINNARRAQELVAEWGSLAAYFWRYEPAAWRSVTARAFRCSSCRRVMRAALPASTPISAPPYRCVG